MNELESISKEAVTM